MVYNHHVCIPLFLTIGGSSSSTGGSSANSAAAGITTVESASAEQLCIKGKLTLYDTYM